jgi:hypothetical protein
MKPIGFVARRDFIVWNKACGGLAQPLCCMVICDKVFVIWLLKEAPFMDGLAYWTVILQSEEAVAGGACARRRKAIGLFAKRTEAKTSRCRTLKHEGGFAIGAGSWCISVNLLVERSARGTKDDVEWMTPILSDQIPRKKVEVTFAMHAFLLLDPKKILDRGSHFPAFGTAREIQLADLCPQTFQDLAGGRLVGFKVQPGEFLANHPVSHRVDIKAENVTAKTIGLQERCPSTHERISYPPATQIMRLVEGFLKRRIRKLREYQPPKKRTGTPREPLMDRNDRPIILLNLLLSKSKRCDKWDVKITFNGHFNRSTSPLPTFLPPGKEYHASAVGSDSLKANTLALKARGAHLALRQVTCRRLRMFLSCAFPNRLKPTACSSLFSSTSL